MLDDLSGGTRQNVPEGAVFVRGSVLDPELVERLFVEHRVAHVFHFAAYAAEGLSHFIRRFNYENNVVGSVNVINAAVRHEAERFVFASSIAVYGAGEALPLREVTVARPEDPYGIAKLAVERDLAAAARMFGLAYTIFRPHNVYGEHQNLADRYRNVIGIFMNQAMSARSLTIFGDGTQSRAFSYVGDIIGPIIASATEERARGQVFNIGGDVPCTVNELAAQVIAISGADVSARHLPAREEVQHAYADHQRAREVFGPGEQTPLEVGLRRMWEWARAVGPQPTSKFGAIEIERNLPSAWVDPD